MRIRTLTRLAAAATALAALALAGCGSSGSAPAAGTGVKLGINPAQVQYLPIMLAADRGYFRDAGVDVQIVPYQGSANAQIPLLARGDIDLSPAVAGPSLFNQYTQGFRIKLLANLTAPKPGYRDGVVFVVRKDVWDSGRVRTIADLKGLEVDASAEGNPVDFLVREALAANGLTPADVSLTHNARTPSDSVEFLRGNVVDVTAMSEPSATQAEQQGLGVRWLGYQDVIPWFQETFLAASETFAQQRPDDARKVMAGYLRAVEEINGAQGRWTPELLAVAAKWTGQSPDVLTAMGGLMYWNAARSIDQAGLDRVQRFWLDTKLVQSAVPIADLVDTAAAGTGNAR
ncbi:ABC transporter substrate-binding protein [Pseudonocardia sp.]|uniref:ABC transporter substrate-binding protein n=1 Tax=Pseudonocardia sp. TaxID=60912 RepID=UPI003D09796F